MKISSRWEKQKRVKQVHRRAVVRKRKKEDSRVFSTLLSVSFVCVLLFVVFFVVFFFVNFFATKEGVFER